MSDLGPTLMAVAVGAAAVTALYQYNDQPGPTVAAERSMARPARRRVQPTAAVNPTVEAPAALAVRKDRGEVITIEAAASSAPPARATKAAPAVDFDTGSLQQLAKSLGLDGLGPAATAEDLQHAAGQLNNQGDLLESLGGFEKLADPKTQAALRQSLDEKLRALRAIEGGAAIADQLEATLHRLERLHQLDQR